MKNIANAVTLFAWRNIDEAPVESDAGAAGDKPSIAVLPFDNLSNDPDQEYFADGITEDIITELSRFQWFFVIARNSSFAYKGSSPDIRDVARELGVQYVLEGSVRKAGNRVRVTAQLIDGTNGHHVWADKFDRSWTIFLKCRRDHRRHHRGRGALVYGSGNLPGSAQGAGEPGFLGAGAARQLAHEPLDPR